MLNPQTGAVKYCPAPPERNDERVQTNFVGLRYDIAGKVWTKSIGTTMPADTTMRTIYVDNTTNPVSFWAGGNHDHTLVKAEPLD